MNVVEAAVELAKLPPQLLFHKYENVTPANGEVADTETGTTVPLLIFWPLLIPVIVN